ncbi:MAG: hypothetical protein J6X30_01975 [Clostridia bacterium]|nr:hypothetical protein [Clostridia bacterium]
MDTKESKIAQKVVLKSKEAFALRIERNKVKNMDIASCTLDETFTAASRFVVTGSVETESPTGKAKTYTYRALVDVLGKEAALAELDVLPLEE